MLTLDVNRFATVYILDRGWPWIGAVLPLASDVDKIEIQAWSPYAFAKAYVLVGDGVEIVVKLNDGWYVYLDKDKL